VRLSHDVPKVHAVFDDPNLVSQAGLVPVTALAQRADLGGLVEDHVRLGRACEVNAQVNRPGSSQGWLPGREADVNFLARYVQDTPCDRCDVSPALSRNQNRQQMAGGSSGGRTLLVCACGR
jgi:hypothetical protein